MKKFLSFLLLSVLSLTCFAQEQKTINGSLKNADGNPVAGATITVKGSKRAVASDAAVRFTIEAAQSDNLVITSIGFEQ